MEKRILIADDNTEAREALKLILNKKGYTTGTVKDGYEALAHLKQNPVHILILDLMMPEKSGIDILPAIKNISPDTKIIIFTGFEKYKGSTYAKIADKFLIKGLSDSIENLLETMEELA